MSSVSRKNEVEYYFRLILYLPVGLACFLWFVGFCFLANQWQATSPDELPLAQGSDAARATIAFCFFSILTWVCMSSCLFCLPVQAWGCVHHPVCIPGFSDSKAVNFLQTFFLHQHLSWQNSSDIQKWCHSENVFSPHYKHRSALYRDSSSVGGSTEWESLPINY